MFKIIFLISLALIGIAFLGLGIQTFFSKKKKFPETRVGHNKELRKKKIYCIKTEQKIIDKQIKKERYADNNCSACG